MEKQKEINPEETRKAIYGEGIIHLVASGYDKSFCGLDAKNIKHTSLGMCCNCDKCLKIAQDILDKQLNNGNNGIPPKPKVLGILPTII